MSMNRIMELVGKKDFRMDDNIPVSYVFRLVLKYMTMLLRGWRKFIFSRSFAKKIFVGKKVKIIRKKQFIFGRNVKLHDGVYIDCLSRDGVTLGENVVLGRGTRIECTGSVAQIGVGVRIGDNSTFANDCFFGAAGGVKIGNDVMVGQYVRFHSENHNYDDMEKLIRVQGVSHKGIKIGNNCWIGAGAVFLDGAELGDGCVVAANAVVTKKFEKNSVIGGVPAKLIKMRGIK